MGNNTPFWLSKWGRSPRQDRRVIEDGKFVELGKVHGPPTPENVPVQEQSALEIVHEPTNVPVREQESKISDVFVSTSEGQSVSEVMQAELEPLPHPPTSERFVEITNKVYDDDLPF